MFRLNNGSQDHKPSRAGSKSSIKAIASRLKPDFRLAVDTDVSQHHGQVPEQVFPTETNQAETGRTGHLQRTTGLRRKFENRNGRNYGFARHEAGNSSAHPEPFGLPSRPDIHRIKAAEDDTLSGNSAAVPPMHNRVKGLRPTPLNLDISPSDRAIPIGISVPSAAISNHTTSPVASTPRTHSPPQYGREATTPTIVITPAKDDFDLTPPSFPSQDRRPTSSVYSRYTNCAPRAAERGETPPVPPLPLFAQEARKRMVPESKATVYEDLRSAKSHTATLSVCTVFEEDEQQQPLSAKESSEQKMKALKRQSTLPTPRRSRGWWNVITSPFSARTNIPFWKSPTDESSDRAAILHDASAMGVSDTPRGAAFDSDPSGLTPPRSAPVSHESPVTDAGVRSVPKRSITAPGAMDPSAIGYNIYRIPSQGEAAAYYDQNRHFPSLIMQPDDAIPRSMFEDDSPLTDVCACEHHRHGNATDSKIAATESGEPNRGSTCSRHSKSARAVVVAEPEELKSPFDDSHAIDDQSKSPETQHRTLFTSPTAEELQSPAPAPAAAAAAVAASPALDRGTTDRGQSDGVRDSRLSIMSSTPVVEDAHMATMVGPRSSNGEQRAVLIPPSRAPTPPSEDNGLQAATMASRSIEQPAEDERPIQTQRDIRPAMHSRESSRGLGISNSEQDLFPPPKLLSEKPRLGTDRFGQLYIDTTEQYDRPRQPWYRRFLWLITAGCMTLLLLLIVLLILFIPQVNSDNPVQAQWLNLTGFPPLPTGVATVVQPKKTLDESRCIQPPGLWSCGIPENQRADLNPEDNSDLPNFRLEIRFRNHTLENTTALIPDPSPASNETQQPALHTRSTWSQLLYSSSPPTPSESDQLALGSKTDNNTSPHNGEETPFYLSLLNPVPLPDLQKRSTDSESSETKPNPYPYPSSNSSAKSHRIPKPLLKPNNRPAPPLLYPYVRSQPLRLYNRGEESEHYGFYVYFDKTVLVKNASLPSSGNSSSSSSNTQTKGALNLVPAPSPADASALCAFPSTRLRVRIWTRRPVSGTSTSVSTKPADDSTGIAAGNSSANDFKDRGSFPYAVSVSLDRHAGPDVEDDNNGGKGVVCWGLDEEGRVRGEKGVWVDQGEGTEDAEEEGEGEGECGCAWES